MPSHRSPSLLPLLAFLLALAGCATPPAAPPREAPLSYPPSVRERILRIAEAEWRDWGGIVLEAEAQAATPREEDHPTPGAARPAESDPLNFPRVLAYWRAVDDAEAAGAVARNRARYATLLAAPGAPSSLWSEPAWSAAFISHVMRSAGLDRREFPPSAAHAFYIDALLADAMAFPGHAPFLPRDWAAYAPRPGDLVCADRSARPLPDWRARLPETGRFRPMHCDIVLTAGPGEVAAVGGNVRDAVTLSRFPADAAGRLLARRGGGPTWFAVFENRLGRLPPWNAIPALAANRSSAW
ncbi:DUF2272 domain-containing protein [Pseudoroseomonas sp. WGS1072]|uniref:DUF2272 domain-containing protein n=1 Tax=Roseomonas sp. WGS1072 TaxID=3366816 RepID=UPI003BF0260C